MKMREKGSALLSPPMIRNAVKLRRSTGRGALCTASHKPSAAAPMATPPAPPARAPPPPREGKAAEPPKTQGHEKRRPAPIGPQPPPPPPNPATPCRPSLGCADAGPVVQGAAIRFLR